MKLHNDNGHTLKLSLFTHAFSRYDSRRLKRKIAVSRGHEKLIDVLKSKRS